MASVCNFRDRQLTIFLPDHRDSVRKHFSRNSATMAVLSRRICAINVQVLCRRYFATVNSTAQGETGQNLTEKIVQRYAVDLPPGKIVKSGDYVSIKPEYCMSHDNCISMPDDLLIVAWPVALKYRSQEKGLILDSRESAQRKSSIIVKL